MTGILDQMGRPAPSPLRTTFQPKTEMEYFALRLAQRLGEPQATSHFVELCDRLTESRLLSAYSHAQKQNDASGDLAARFHIALERPKGKSLDGPSHRQLAAIRIARRTAVIVILKGDQMQYPPLVRQLPADNEKALESIAVFLDRTLQRCPFERAVMESVEDAEIQRRPLTDTACRFLSEQAVSIWQMSKADVIASFGYPPPRFRKELRAIAAGIWPDVPYGFKSSPLILDALALGLYTQVEFLFNS